MVFHHRRYVGAELSRAALSILLPQLKRPDTTLIIRTRGGVDSSRDVDPTPETIVGAVMRPGSATRFVPIEAGGDVVGRMEREGLLLMEPGPWLEDLREVPHEQVPWSWLLTFYDGEGYPTPVINQAEKAILDVVHRSEEEHTIARLGLSDLDQDLELWIGLPGTRAGRVSRSKRHVRYTKPWASTGDLTRDAHTWWEEVVTNFNPDAGPPLLTERSITYSLTQAGELKVSVDDVEDAIEEALEIHGGDSDNPTESGDVFTIPILDGTDEGLAAAVAALQELGLTSAQET